MKNKLGLFFVLAFIGIFLGLFSGIGNIVAAQTEQWTESTTPDISEMTIYVNRNAIWHGYCWDNGVDYSCQVYQIVVPALERGETMSIKVAFKSNVNLDEVKIRAWINGYREEIEDATGKFDVFANNLYSKNLFLALPYDIDALDEYSLHVKIEGKKEFSGVDKADIDTSVQRVANLLEILSVELYDHGYSYRESGCDGECAVTFEGGTTLYTDIVVKNRGNHIAEDVYVRVSIPELCIERTVYLGDLGSYDNMYQDTKRVTVSLPLPEKKGTYQLVIEAFNSKIETRETRTLIIKHKAKSEIEVTPQIREDSVKHGETAKFSFSVTNLGEGSEKCIVEVLGADELGRVKINPASFTLKDRESKSVDIYVYTNTDIEAGTYPFTVRVKYGDKDEQFTMNMNVEKSIKVDLKSALMIIGIVLAIVVIILLVVILTKQKVSEEEKPETVESYY